MFTVNDIQTGVRTDTADYALVKEFASVPYWRPEYRKMFAEDFSIFLPYAPMGWLQYMDAYVASKHWHWITETVRTWEWLDDGENKVYATDHEGVFYVLHNGRGHIYQWAKEEGDYQSLFVHRVHVKNGKIVFLQTMFDSAEMYKTIHNPLPTWYHDWERPDIYPGRYPDWKPQPKLEHKTMEDLQKQVNASLSHFNENICYIATSVMEKISDDFTFEIPYAPDNMTRVFRAGPEYYAQSAWLRKVNVEEEIGPIHFYKTQDPHIYISEFDCYCYTYWAYIYGHYYNHEISYITLNDEGRIKRILETFNPMQKFNSTAVSIPSIPQFF